MMAQSINIAVRCPECNWRVMDKVSPTTGKIEIKCPTVTRSWRSIWPCAGKSRIKGPVSFKYYIGGSDNRIRSKSTEQRVIVPQG